MNIKYITLEEALYTHERSVVNSGGGTLESLDVNRLESVLENIKNDDWYPEFIDKLTHLFFCVCQFHCFRDGNKRLALALSALFLIHNGYIIAAQNFFKNTENIVIHVASGKVDKDLLRKLLLATLNNTYDTDEELKLEYMNAISKE